MPRNSNPSSTTARRPGIEAIGDLVELVAEVGCESRGPQDVDETPRIFASRMRLLYGATEIREATGRRLCGLDDLGIDGRVP